MDRLEGYSTNGYEYRKSEIDRSNSKRLKWMMNEARKNVEKGEAQKAKNSFVKGAEGLENTKLSDKKDSINRDGRMCDFFNASTVNKFSRSDINNPFNKKN